MNISLSPETQKLIEEQMKLGHFPTPDGVVRTALQTLAETRGEDYEDLEAETRAAIEETRAQCQRSEGRPWADVRAELLARFVNE